jgi:hypothetical protein
MMEINFDAWMPWIMLLFGLGAVWLVVSIVLKAARTVISIGCSLLVLIALAVLVVNIL